MTTWNKYVNKKFAIEDEAYKWSEEHWNEVRSIFKKIEANEEVFEFMLWAGRKSNKTILMKMLSGEYFFEM